MKILLNAMPLKGLLTGISRYLRNLYLHIGSHQDIEVDYYDGKTLSDNIPVQAEPGSWIKSTDKIWQLPDVAVVGLRSIHWLLYENRLRRTIRKGDYDIYHETAFTPASINKLKPQVFTLHDLSLMHYRSCHPKERVWFSDLFFSRRLPQADHIIVPSNFIRDEVCAAIPLPENKVTAIPEAPDPFFTRRPDQQVKRMRKDLSLPERFLLFVGTLEPRKNLELIIEALCSSGQNIPLVLAGWKGWGEKSWMDKAARFHIEKNIYMTGYIDEDTLACLYSGATALIYPSRYEGFGLPVLEAMACGCPVISSSAASLPEVGGDAAVYINPDDATALARTLEKVFNDRVLREKLSKKGIEQASRFSWKTAALKTIDVFQTVVNI